MQPYGQPQGQMFFAYSITDSGRIKPRMFGIITTVIMCFNIENALNYGSASFVHWSFDLFCLFFFVIYSCIPRIWCGARLLWIARGCWQDMTVHRNYERYFFSHSNPTLQDHRGNNFWKSQWMMTSIVTFKNYFLFVLFVKKIQNT